MRNAVITVGVMVLAAAVAGSAAEAGGSCHECRGGWVAHEAYEGTGCGPKVYGPVREPVDPVDQCDACARFAGHDGYRQMPELLVPWQLPPGRGFQPPEAFGYRSGECAECAACGAWPRVW